MQVRQAFATRQQSDREDWMQYLDPLEGLRSQGFQNEPVTTKRYEFLQRFIEGASPSPRPPWPTHPRYNLRDLQPDNCSAPDPNLRNPMIPGMLWGRGLIPLCHCPPIEW